MKLLLMVLSINAHFVLTNYVNNNSISESSDANYLTPATNGKLIKVEYKEKIKNNLEFYTQQIHEDKTLWEKPKHYYTNYNDKGRDDSTIGFYLGYATKRINTQHSSYKIRHYGHNTEKIIPETNIYSDTLTVCNINAITLCPFKTESICFSNGTIMCSSNVTATVPCQFDTNLACIDTMVPCVPDKSFSKCNADYMEEVSLSCLTNATMINVLDQNGFSLLGISGTFVSVAKPPQIELFCITIVADLVEVGNNYSVMQ